MAMELSTQKYPRVENYTLVILVMREVFFDWLMRLARVARMLAEGSPLKWI